MAKMEIPKCAWCGGPMPAPGRRGPARVTCSDPCRKARQRARQMVSTEYMPAHVEAIGPVPDGGPHVITVPLDDQVARAVLETHALSSTFLRLGHEARPEFAWRCERLGLAMKSALGKYFEGV